MVFCDIFSILSYIFFNDSYVPLLVQLHEKWRRLYRGICLGSGFRTMLEMVHLRRVPKQFNHLKGLLDVFKDKFVSSIGENIALEITSSCKLKILSLVYLTRVFSLHDVGIWSMFSLIFLEFMCSVMDHFVIIPMEKRDQLLSDFCCKITFKNTGADWSKLFFTDLGLSYVYQLWFESND